MATKSRLTRSSSQKIFGGVCGGMAEYFGWEATNMRLLYVGVSLLSAAFPGLLVYLLLWALIPAE